MEESVKGNNTELKHMVIICCNGILQSLLNLTSYPTSQHMSDVFMEKINSLYPDLESCDYIGKRHNFFLSFENVFTFLFFLLKIDRCPELSNSSPYP